MLDVKDSLRAVTFFLGKLHLFVMDITTHHHTAINILIMQIKTQNFLKTSSNTLKKFNHFYHDQTLKITKKVKIESPASPGSTQNQGSSDVRRDVSGACAACAGAWGCSPSPRHRNLMGKISFIPSPSL